MGGSVQMYKNRAGFRSDMGAPPSASHSPHISTSISQKESMTHEISIDTLAFGHHTPNSEEVKGLYPLNAFVFGLNLHNQVRGARYDSKTIKAFTMSVLNRRMSHKTPGNHPAMFSDDHICASWELCGVPIDVNVAVRDKHRRRTVVCLKRRGRVTMANIFGIHQERVQTCTDLYILLRKITKATSDGIIDIEGDTREAIEQTDIMDTADPDDQFWQFVPYATNNGCEPPRRLYTGTGWTGKFWRVGVVITPPTGTKGLPRNLSQMKQIVHPSKASDWLSAMEQSKKVEVFLTI